jgi:hypothetical protein
MPAPFSASSTVPSSALSIFTDALDDETCTAGTSGKKFGTMYNRPNASVTPIRMYFQAG